MRGALLAISRPSPNPSPPGRGVARTSAKPDALSRDLTLLQQAGTPAPLAPRRGARVRYGAETPGLDFDGEILPNSRIEMDYVPEPASLALLAVAGLLRRRHLSHILS